MDDSADYEEESLSRMQKEMEDLRQRENELARKIAQANRQKSLSRESLGDSQDQRKGRVGAISPRRSSGEGSPTRDFFHGRNIESKVAKYIRGEDPYLRGRTGSDLKRSSSDRLHSSTSPTRSGRSLRSSSHPENGTISWRQDTPRQRARKDLETGMHKSTPNLSTIDGRSLEETEPLSDDEGMLRSRSKQKVRFGKYASAGNLDGIDIPENKLLMGSDQDVTSSSVSFEINKGENKQRTSQQNLINFDERKDTNVELKADEALPLLLKDSCNQECEANQNASGSTIDIDSIVWSGNTTKEDDAEQESQERARSVSWSPDDILIGGNTEGKSTSQTSVFMSSRVHGLPITNASDDLTSGNLGNVRGRSDDENDSSDEASAREMILDAKTKIEREIEEFQKREEELKSTRRGGTLNRKPENEGKNEDEGDNEEYFEAKETLISDTRGIIEREIEEIKQRENEYKNRQKMIYGGLSKSDEARSDSEEEEVDEVEANIHSESLGLDSRGKIEREMEESLQRETEYQNRFAKIVSPPAVVREDDSEEEEVYSSEEETGTNAPTDAVTKIEREIEEARQRENELRYMRLAKEAQDVQEEEIVHTVSKTIEETSKIDPIRKIEMEIEQDRRRDLELKQRYGLNRNEDRGNEVKENGNEYSEEEDEEEEDEEEEEEEDVEEVGEETMTENKGELLQHAKGYGPGRLRIPEAFQSIAKKGFKSSTEYAEFEGEGRTMHNRAHPEKGLEKRVLSPEVLVEASGTYRRESKGRESGLDGKTDKERDFYPNDRREGTPEEKLKKRVASKGDPSSSCPTEDPDLGAVRSGFTKEKIYLFDPSRKQASPKVKENIITKTKKRFESSDVPAEPQTQRSQLSVRGSDSSNRPDLNKSTAAENKGKTGLGFTKQTANKFMTDAQAKSKNDSNIQGGKKYVLKKKSSTKSKKDNTPHPELSSEVDSRQRSRTEEDYGKHNGDWLKNGGAQKGSTKPREEENDYQVTSLRFKKKGAPHVESEIEARKRNMEEQRRRSESLNSQRAQNLSREQLKKRDALLASERQREKRRSLAELWEKNMATRDDEMEISPNPPPKVEPTEKAKVQSARKSEGKKKTSMLKASAQLRVQQWEQIIASRGHISGI